MYCCNKGGDILSTDKKLTIIIPEETHSELKMLAVVRKTSMKDIILECIKKEIQKSKK